MRHPGARSGVSTAIVAYLETGQFRTIGPTEGPTVDDWEVIDKSGANDPRLLADWEAVRDSLLAKWVIDHPGTRPWYWWLHDAPTEPVTLAPDRIWRDEDRTAAHRRRVGGTGTPRHEVRGATPAFDRGLPTQWFSAWELLYYNGKATYIPTGEPIGTEFHDGDLVADAIDPKNPPTFKSEAAYLRRHGLFLPGEEKRLTSADFEPEAVRG
jgi:hypothetical protein